MKGKSFLGLGEGAVWGTNWMAFFKDPVKTLSNYLPRQMRRSRDSTITAGCVGMRTADARRMCSLEGHTLQLLVLRFISLLGLHTHIASITRRQNIRGS